MPAQAMQGDCKFVTAVEAITVVLLLLLLLRCKAAAMTYAQAEANEAEESVSRLLLLLQVQDAKVSVRSSRQRSWCPGGGGACSIRKCNNWSRS